MRWTNEEVNFLKKNYLIMDYNEMGRILNKKPKQISSKGRKLGLLRGSGANTQYPINSNYFKIWSHNMFYILGYITADGCVTDSNRLILQCKLDDIELLEFIKSEISPSRPISRPTQLYKGKTFYQCRLELKDITIIKDLRTYNIIPRKTGKESLPDIPEEYKWDYLRGLFDGDGCIHHGKYLDKRNGRYYKQNSFTISSASELFLYDIKYKICFGYGGIVNNKNCFNYRITDKQQIKEISRLIYNNEFSLKRKYNIFIDGECV